MNKENPESLDSALVGSDLNMVLNDKILNILESIPSGAHFTCLIDAYHGGKLCCYTVTKLMNGLVLWCSI